MIYIGKTETNIKKVVEDAKNQNQNNNEDTLIQGMLKQFGGNEVTPTKPEISALQFNESQFNFQEDSQMNDIIEVSNYAKPSDAARFLGGWNNIPSESIVDQFTKHKRKTSNFGDADDLKINDKDPKERKESDLENIQSFIPPVSNKIENPFADLDTSGIDGGPDHIPFVANFEPGDDNSFIGPGTLPNNNIFSPTKPQEVEQEEPVEELDPIDPPKTPCYGDTDVSFIFFSKIYRYLSSLISLIE